MLSLQRYLNHFVDNITIKSRVLYVGELNTLVKTLQEIFPNTSYYLFDENFVREDVLNISLKQFDYIIFYDILNYFTFLEVKNILDKICSEDVLCMVYHQGLIANEFTITDISSFTEFDKNHFVNYEYV